MKCPVCDQENSTLRCSRCGFDGSRNYGRYPTFGTVKRTPSVSALRRQQQERQRKPTPKPNGPQHVDYLKMVSQAAEEDRKKREQLHQQVTPNIPAKATHDAAIREVTQRQNHLVQDEIDNLQASLEFEKASNQRLLDELQMVKRRLDEVRGEKLELGQKQKALLKRIESLEQENSQLNNRIRALEQENAELRVPQEANPSKGILGRFFGK